jgi:hypothetical protein
MFKENKRLIFKVVIFSNQPLFIRDSVAIRTQDPRLRRATGLVETHRDKWLLFK